MPQDATVQKVLHALDRGQFTPADWENAFLEDLTRQPFALTQDQHATLVTLAEVYCAPGLAAALHSQHTQGGSDAP